MNFDCDIENTVCARVDSCELINVHGCDGCWGSWAGSEAQATRSRRVSCCPNPEVKIFRQRQAQPISNSECHNNSQITVKSCIPVTPLSAQYLLVSLGTCMPSQKKAEYASTARRRRQCTNIDSSRQYPISKKRSILSLSIKA